MSNWLRSVLQYSRKAKLFRIAGYIFFLLLTGFIVYLLLRDGGKLLQQHLHFRPGLLALSFVVECSSLLVAIPVWRRIMGTYGVHQSLRDDIRIYNYSALALVLPGGIWNIVSRSALYQRLGERSLLVATASVVETLIVAVAAAGVYLICTILRPEISLWKSPGVGIFFFVLILLLLNPRIFNRLLNWALRVAKRKEITPEKGFGFSQIAAWISLETIVLTVAALSVFILLASMTDVNTSLFIPVLAAWVAGVAAGNFLFWLPGTPVLHDGAMILILTPSLTLPIATAFVLLVRVWSLLSLLLAAGLVWLIFDLPFHPKTRAKGSLIHPKNVE